MKHLASTVFPPLVLRRNGGTCQNEMTKSFGMIHMEPYSIPELWGNLPFVNKPRRRTFQQFPDVCRCLGKIALKLIGVGHV